MHTYSETFNSNVHGIQPANIPTDFHQLLAVDAGQHHTSTKVTEIIPHWKEKKEHTYQLLANCQT
jgi:hypothetical protein